MPDNHILNPDPSKLIFSVFDNAVTVHQHTYEPSDHSQSNLAFAYFVTFNRSSWPSSLGSEKPPLHFHPYQEEYIQVLEGQVCVDIEGETRMLGPSDGELCVRPWVNHRLYPPREFSATVTAGKGTEEEEESERREEEEEERGCRPNSNPMQTIKFLLSGEESGRLLGQLDSVFFENWYRYQEVAMGVDKGGFNIVQVMSMFDAGGSYLSLPWWVPFSRTCALVVGVVVGRWLGSLFGYQPYYRQWTHDWELACRKMRSSIWQRRFAGAEKEG